MKKRIFRLAIVVHIEKKFTMFAKILISNVVVI